MSRRKQNDIYFIDGEIEHLKKKRDQLTRKSITKKELKELVPEYEEYLRTEHVPLLAEGSIKVYLSQVNDFIENYTSFDEEVTRKTTLEYRTKIINKYKPSTIDTKFTAVSKFLVYAGLYDAKLEKLKVQKEQGLDNVIEVWEYKKLLSTVRSLINQDKAQALLWTEMYHTIRTFANVGIRQGEREYFTYVNLKSGPDISLFFKGTHKLIPVRSNIRADLIAFAEETNRLDGSIFHLDDKKVRYRLKMIARRAGVSEEKIHPHNFRHFFAIQFMNQGGNIQVLKQILGHSDIKTTAIYLQQTQTNVRKQLDSMKLVESSIDGLDTDVGDFIDKFEKEVYVHRGNWTKKVAIEIATRLLQNRRKI